MKLKTEMKEGNEGAVAILFIIIIMFLGGFGLLYALS